MILDQFGRKYPESPKRPVNVAGIAGVPQPAQRYSSSLDASPENVARALAAAARGDADAYLTLAEQMEEKYLHYAAQLSTRKQAILGEEMEVCPGDDSALAQEIADAFERVVVETDPFQDLCLDLLDGIAKGFAVCQPYWDTSVTPWRYAAFEHVDQRLFQFDRDTLRELRYKSDTSDDGIRIPRGQFIVHRPRVRTAIPLRAGIARAAAVGYLFHSSTARQWTVFVNVFGMPTRIATYDPATATEEELSQLRQALVNIGHDAAAMIPHGMEITAFDARRPTSGDNVYKEHAEYWDMAISKLLLGQTMTADNGSSKAQADVHNDVRTDIKRSDARQLCSTIHRDVLTPWVLYNYGENAPIPTLHINVEPPEDQVALSTALKNLVSVGLKVKADEVRERLGLSRPEEGDEILEMPTPEPAGPQNGGKPADKGA